jgi:endonuclease G, mitochondrial
MKMLILLLTCIATATPAFAAPAQHPAAYCKQFLPYGSPTVAEPHGIGIPVCRTAYTLLSDQSAEIPVWVAYTLTPEHALGCAVRSNAFTADDSLPDGERAKPTDYAGSGYDIGHIAPDGDMSWDPDVERESFILTNMTPQLPGLNRGIWKLLETSVRAHAYESGHTLLIYAGPVYNVAKDAKIGKDRIDVPTAFYKIVVDMKTGEYTAFLFPQAGDQGNDLEKVHSSLAEVERATGIMFPMPRGAKDAPIWSADFKALATAKKAQCGK